MKLGIGFGAALLSTLLMVATPANAGALAGTGTATFGFCPPNSDTFALAGAENGGVWTFALGDANALVGTGCEIAGGQAYQGAWNPTTGGCVAGVAVGGILCLGAVPTTGTPTTTGITVCALVVGCVTGTATVVRA